MMLHVHADSSGTSDSNYQTSITKFFYKRVPVLLSYRDVLLSILKWVTLDGRPLDIINDSGFDLIRQMVKRMDSTFPTVNEKNVRTMVKNVAAHLRERMRNIFKNNYLSLKIDSASYHARKFIGIMCQTRNVNDMKNFHTYTLACREVHGSQSTDNIRKTVVNVLGEFGVDEDHIMSLTTDNAANICGVSDRINEINAPKKKKKSDNSEKKGETNADDNYGDFEIEELIIFSDEEDDHNPSIDYDEIRHLALGNAFPNVTGK